MKYLDNFYKVLRSAALVKGSRPRANTAKLEIFDHIHFTVHPCLSQHRRLLDVQGHLSAVDKVQRVFFVRGQLTKSVWPSQTIFDHGRNHVLFDHFQSFLFAHSFS
jgi:hypothetical protein